MVRKWLGKGILGIGQRRGLFTPGEILVLVYSPEDNLVVTVQSMRGFSIFVHFREKSEYSRLSLEELRSRALEEDRRDLGLWRIIFRYQPLKISKRKGALIQAVEAVERHLAQKYPSQAVPAYFLLENKLAVTVQEKNSPEGENAG